NDEIFMSACMTVQVDSNRKRCNMTRCCFNLYIECSSIAAEPLRPDAEFIDRLMDLPFKIGDAFNRMSLTDRTEQRLVSKITSDFEIPADSYADHSWRTGIRHGFLHGLHDKILDTAQAYRRCEHLHRTHVLITTSLC